MSNPYALHAAKWGDGEIRAARASEARTRLSNLSVDTTNLYVHPTKSAASASTSESLVSFRAPHPPSSITTDHSPFSTYAKFSPDEKSDVDDYDDGSDGHGSGGYDSDHNYESYEYDSDSDYEYGFSSEEHHANCTWAAEHRLWVEQQRANADNRDARPPVENQHDEPSVRTLDGESDEDADNHGGPCAFCSRAAGYTEEGSGFSIDPPRTLLVTDDEDASGYISPFRYAPVGHHRRSPIANERTSPDPFIATPSPRPDVHSSRQDPRPITPLPHPIFRREGSPAPCSVPARVAVDPIHTRPMPKESYVGRTSLWPSVPAQGSSQTCFGPCFSLPPSPGPAEEGQRSDDDGGSRGDDGDSESEKDELFGLDSFAYQGDYEDEDGEASEEEDGKYHRSSLS